MKLRIVLFVLLGILIAGGIAVPVIGFPCESCDSEGKLVCPTCNNSGVIPYLFYVECVCGGKPVCDLCYGFGFYPMRTFDPCVKCEGEGWISCSSCGGDGKINLLEQVLNLGTDN